MKRRGVQIGRQLTPGRTFQILILSLSTRRAATANDEVFSTDVVLDVRQMRRWATAVGRRVTVVSVDGAIHDVVLSRPEPRARVYAELDRWLGAYVEPRDTRIEV